MIEILNKFYIISLRVRSWCQSFSQLPEARFLRPTLLLTRYETLVETVYSSFGASAVATRFVLEDPEAGSAFADGSLLLSGWLCGSEVVVGSLELSGSFFKKDY